MSFLTPLFLLGLAAIAIPVIVHLTHRHTGEVVPFPSLMFLERVPFRSMRRQKIRHWFLLALRAAALILLALAFARPFFAGTTLATALTAESREVVILLDRSFSMSYGDQWERARQAARNTVRGLRSGDRASLILFDEGAQLAVRPTSEASALLPLLEAAEPGSRGTRYGPAIKLARQLLDESDLPAGEVVLITDYQRNGWSADDDAALPEQTILTGHDVTEGTPANVVVTDLLTQREFDGEGEELALSARVVNQGPEPRAGLEVTLEVDGAALQGRSVEIEPEGSTTVSFDSIPVTDETLRATVQAGTDDLAADNRFHFVVEPERAVSVLIVEAAGAQETDSLFVERALAIGSRPAFRVRTTGAGGLSAAALSGVSLVILNDTAPSAGALRAIRDWVERGGGLLVALGELVDPQDWSGGAGSELIPAFGAPIDRNADLGGTLASFDRSHPVFEVFGAPRSGDFTQARFYRYRALEPGPGDRVLAEFDDGRVALLERDAGDGRVLVWPSSLDRFWNDLATQPVFLPFLHQAAKHASGYVETRPFYRVGDPVAVDQLLDPAAIEPGSLELLTLTGGTAVGDDDSSTISLPEPGFYRLRWREAGTTRERLLAANLDRSESDLSRVDAEELAAAVGGPGAAGETALAEQAASPAARESRQSTWWYLLVVATLLFAAESLVANRMAPLAR